MKVCSKCTIEKDEKEFYKHKHNKDGLNYWCKECTKKFALQWQKDHPEQYKAGNNNRAKIDRKNLKEVVYNHYGNKCACCGETTEEFLTIDHINNDGAKQRKVIGRKMQNMYLWIIGNDFPDEFQILCWNCNCGRHKNNGVCPHNRHTPLPI
jgi:hypothetical protein